MATPAAGRLSTTICWPSCSDIFAATRRITVSVGPAAASATTRRTGRVGYESSAACAAWSATTAQAVDMVALIRSIVYLVQRQTQSCHAGALLGHASPDCGLGRPDT